MRKTTVLVLGASINQLPLVLDAKSRGAYVITVDNVPENICHKYSDHFENISTTDKIAVLAYAKKVKAKGLITCASDLALPTVCYVCEKMKLPSARYKSVLSTINKNQFREFQKKHHIQSPKCYSFESIDAAIKNQELFINGQWVIKPVDSSGSKGVSFYKKTSKISYAELVQKAFPFSRSKNIIVEEYIEGSNCSIDGFILNGKIELFYITNKYLTPFPGLTPIAHTIPSLYPPSIQKKIKTIVTNMLTLLKVTTSPFDFDIIVTGSGEVYILEMSLRIGGNGIPQIIRHATGIDLYHLAMSHALGVHISRIYQPKQRLFTGVFLIRSPKSGKLKSVANKKSIIRTYKKYVREIVYDVDIGSKVEEFTQGNHRIGHVIVQAKSEKSLHRIFNSIYTDMKLVIA